MEVRQKLTNVPIRPIVLMVALFCAIVIALAGWYALAASSPTRVSPGAVTTSGGFPGPAAREQIAHNRSEEGLGGAGSVGGEQIAHNRSEEGLANR
jgi:hypothetical protein